MLYEIYAALNVPFVKGRKRFNQGAVYGAIVGIMGTLAYLEVNGLLVTS